MFLRQLWRSGAESEVSPLHAPQGSRAARPCAGPTVWSLGRRGTRAGTTTRVRHVWGAVAAHGVPVRRGPPRRDAATPGPRAAAPRRVCRARVAQPLRGTSTRCDACRVMYRRASDRARRRPGQADLASEMARKRSRDTGGTRATCAAPCWRTSSNVGVPVVAPTFINALTASVAVRHQPRRRDSARHHGRLSHLRANLPPT